MMQARKHEKAKQVQTSCIERLFENFSLEDKLTDPTNDNKQHDDTLDKKEQITDNSSGACQQVTKDEKEKNVVSNKKEIVREKWPIFYNSVHFEKPDITFDDLFGYKEVKNQLRADVVGPLTCPSKQGKCNKLEESTFFMLYGPPGTGKTRFAKALATEVNNCTFIQVSNAKILSRYVGGSEKIITSLFQMAKELKPSIIFIDHAEAMLGDRDNAMSSARHFFKEMQNCLGVVVVGTTDYPERIDRTLRRRFPNKCFVGMPSPGERTLMFKHHLKGLFTDDEFRKLGDASDGFLPSDIDHFSEAVCQNVFMKIVQATHFKPCPFRKGQMGSIL